MFSHFFEGFIVRRYSSCIIFTTRNKDFCNYEVSDALQKWITTNLTARLSGLFAKSSLLCSVWLFKVAENATKPLYAKRLFSGRITYIELKHLHDLDNALQPTKCLMLLSGSALPKTSPISVICSVYAVLRLQIYIYRAHCYEAIICMYICLLRVSARLCSPLLVYSYFCLSVSVSIREPLKLEL